MFWYLLLIFPLGVIVDQYIFKIFPPKTEQNLFTMKSGEKQNWVAMGKDTIVLSFDIWD